MWVGDGHRNTRKQFFTNTANRTPCHLALLSHFLPHHPLLLPQSQEPTSHFSLLRCFSLPSLPLHVLLSPWAVVSHVSLNPSWDVILSRKPPRHPSCVLHGLPSGSSSEPVRQVCGVYLLPLLHGELFKGRTCIMFTIHTRVTGVQNAHQK